MDAPWTPRQLMERLLVLRQSWEDTAAQILADAFFYEAIADLGRDVFRAQIDCVTEPWIDGFYSIVEQSLMVGDMQARNLIIAGLFESLQRQSYKEGPHDLVERKLGPASLSAWRRLMEGWNGGGVRTIEQWRGRPRHR